MLYIFGDIHLSAMNPWNIDIGENFIKWFDDWSNQVIKNDSAAEILWLGDITEKDVNPGDVIDQEFRIFSMCSQRFQQTYVLMGNHDIKLYRQRAQHSLKFLQNFPKTIIIDEPKDIVSCNTKIRCLPHVRTQGQTLSEYYSNMVFRTDTDLVVGHWNKYDPKMPYAGGVKTNNMRSKDFCLGHIHTRVDSQYTGSIYANKVTEEGERVYKVYDNGSFVKEVALPTFIKYNTIEYPNKAPEINDSSVHVYTIIGMTSLNSAKSYYSDIYIRGVESKKIDKDQTQGFSSDEVFLYKDNYQAYNDWLKETKYPLSRKAGLILSDILKKQTA